MQTRYFFSIDNENQYYNIENKFTGDILFCTHNTIFYVFIILSNIIFNNKKNNKNIYL